MSNPESYYCVTEDTVEYVHLSRVEAFRIRLFYADPGSTPVILVENTDMDGVSPSTLGLKIARHVWAIIFGMPDHTKFRLSDVRYYERNRGSDGMVCLCRFHTAGKTNTRFMPIAVDRTELPHDFLYNQLKIADTRKVTA